MRRRALLASLSAGLATLSAGGALAQAGQGHGFRQALALAGRGNWAEAEAQVGAASLAGKIIRWLKLVSGPIEPDEAAGFLSANPDWPSADAIRRRAEAVLASGGSDDAVRLWAQKFPPLSAPFRLRLAEILPPAEAQAQARTGWIELVPDEAAERRALDRVGPLLSANDHIARFDRLAWSGQPQAAGRMLPLLPAGYAPTARAALELLAGRDAPDGDPANATIFVRRARLLRTTDRDAEALAWWQRAPRPAEPERAAGIWAERQAMARRTLRLGDPAGALRVAGAHGLSGSAEPHLDALFLTGWLALRFNGDPRTAARAFDALSQVAVAPISVARGRYWRGRAAAALDQDALPHYRAAAAHPATYYGQLAILALGEGEQGIADRLKTLPQPTPDPAVMQAFLGRELARAARILDNAGERSRARLFLLRLEQLAPDAADRANAAALAAAIGRVDVGVEIARRVGPKDGATLLEAGWPAPFTPAATDGVEPALVLALIRQESNFDHQAVSPAGARGLMQLMPATARNTAKRIGVATTPTRLTAEPSHNMALGTAYLAEQLAYFDQAIPLALAAYNAGPHRVTQWLADAGDPRIGAKLGGADPIDWVERIPFSETRNYVQRVVESVLVYRARLGESGRHPLNMGSETMSTGGG
jgi:soluble lytic murein transglycosylase